MHSNRSVVGAVVATSVTLLAGLAMGAPSLAAPPLALGAASASSSRPGQATADFVAGVSSVGGITVEVPRVAFGPNLTNSSGHLSAAVLLSDPTVSGTASVLGADPEAGCAVALVQGVVARIECALPMAAIGAQTIAVTLSDGWQLVVSVP